MSTVTPTGFRQQGQSKTYRKTVKHTGILGKALIIKWSIRKLLNSTTNI